MINPPMFYSQSGYALTKQFEGCRLTSYQDSRGKWTIGYGHTAGVTAGMTCTEAQASMWLQQDIAQSVNDVNQLVNVQLTQGEFDALVDFDFNLGRGNLASSTLLAKLNSGDCVGAAAELDKWDHCGGQVLAGLLRRRQAETVKFNGGSDASQT